MNQFDLQWLRLIERARHADDWPAVSVPLGFATRVVSRAVEMSRGSPRETMERFAVRGLFVAMALVVLTITLSYSTARSDGSFENDFPDIVGELVDGF